MIGVCRFTRSGYYYSLPLYIYIITYFIYKVKPIGCTKTAKRGHPEGQPFKINLTLILSMS